MARTRSKRKAQKTRKIHRGGDYLNDYEKKEAALKAAEKKRRDNTAAARAAEKAARTPAAIESKKKADAAAFHAVGKSGMAILNNSGLVHRSKGDPHSLTRALRQHQKEQFF